MVDVLKLKGKIVEKGLSISEFAELAKLEKSTLYRRFSSSGEDFSIKEADKICDVLKLSSSEATSIFFNQFVAFHATQ